MSMVEHMQAMQRYLRGKSDESPLANAETYRELIIESLSGLLSTNLPRTAERLAMPDAVRNWLAQGGQTTPYFHRIAAEFVESLPEGADKELAHYESLQLQLESASDDSESVLAAYEWRVHEPEVPPGVAFLKLTRDATTQRVMVRELTAAEFVAASESAD